MNSSGTDITVIIVNYKVKEYIANLLSSISKARQGLKLQIIVVDNASGDQSVEYLSERFPEVTYIANEENLGFGKANNQAIKIAEGTYTLIINPDTVVSEDTFTTLIDHMQEHPECGAAGCKILNPDGSFAPESRRSVPTIWSAFSRVLGLNSLFPKSKLFNQYNMSWLDENEQAEIPVLSGSFMFWRTGVLQQLGGFDERFFMYGEDIDLCYRIQDTGKTIHYVPGTSIIHYKGESTRKGDLKYIWIFNKALLQFFDKHHSSKYSFFFKVFIYSAIWLKTLTGLITHNLHLIGFVTTDLLLLNASIVLGFLLRFQFSYEVFSNIQNFRFLWINLLASAIYVFTGSFLDLFRSQKESISNQLRAIAASYFGVAFITFFARNLAYSRLALIIGFGISIVLMLLIRLVQINLSRNERKVAGRLKRSRVLLVGDTVDTEEIRAKIHSRPDWNYEVIGTISVKEHAGNALGSLSQLEDLIKAYQADQVLFSLKSISYKNMLRQISMLQPHGILFKLIPDSMDFILGKSNVEYLESIPLVEVGLAYSKGTNQFLKRLLDLMVSVPSWLILWAITFPGLIFSRTDKKKVAGMTYYSSPESNKWKNRTLMFWNIVRGKMSLVGFPFYYRTRSGYHSKPGLTGLIQLNQSRIQSPEDRENYELYYLQNYSVWMDIDILMKTVFNGAGTTESLVIAMRENPS